MDRSVQEGVPSRVARKRAERVARVERTAARMFAERGYEGANLEEIAARLDLRGPSLYHYFSSKEELFLRCVRSSADEVITRLGSVAAAEPEPVERPKCSITSLHPWKLGPDPGDDPKRIPATS